MSEKTRLSGQPEGSTRAIFDRAGFSVQTSIGEHSGESGPSISTPSPFLTHMFENLQTFVPLPICLSVIAKGPILQHDLCEDTGFCFGRSIRRYCEKEAARGHAVQGYGSAHFAVVESLVLVTGNLMQNWDSFRIRNESRLPLNGPVEDLRIENLVAFFEGFSRGCGVELFIVLFAGEDPHHLWEAVFRALGVMLRHALAAGDGTHA